MMKEYFLARQTDKPGMLAIQSQSLTWQRRGQQWLVTYVPSFLAPCLQVLTFPYVRKTPTFLVTHSAALSCSVLDWPGAVV